MGACGETMAAGMNTLVALALSTPVWGFSLQPPVAAAPHILPEQTAQVRTTVVETETTIETVPSDLWLDGHTASMMNWTRAFQVATTITMAGAAVMGIIQFHDEYNFQSDYSTTPCGSGGQFGRDAVFPDYCGESTPWPHLIVAGSAASALITTVGISTAVDFDRASRRDGDWRTYETTRWIALALGVLQAGAGAFLANAQRADILTYQDDFDVMQGFAIAHMALGVANFGMNLYNSILLF